MTLQFELDWGSKLPPSAQVGMAVCDANADERWKRWTDGAIQAVARRLPEFTADDVVAELDKMPSHALTHNGSALGPRLKEVAKTLHYMRATDRVQRSKRPLSHGNLLRVWESLLWRQP
jgi:hypothetical protein